eukprot:83241_1
MTSITGWYIGVGLGIGSSIISNLGVNIQKLAHSNRAKKLKAPDHINMQSMGNFSFNDTTYTEISKLNIPIESVSPTTSLINVVNSKQKPYLLDIKWILGLLLQITGAMMDFTALGFAPASVVAPLGSLTLVTNVFLAPIMHNEKPTTKILLATALIIFGTIITVIFSPRVTNVNTTEALFKLFVSASFVIYSIPCIMILVSTFVITKYMSYIKLNFNSEYSSMHYKLHRFSIATLSGTMGAQNIFFAKCMSTLLVFSIEGNGKMFLLLWQTYLVLIGLLSTIYYQIKWLNKGLMEFSALYIVPIFQSFWITLSVIGGLTVYEEFDKMEVTHKIIFPMGVIVTITGVAFLTSQKKPTQINMKTGNAMSPSAVN